MDTSVNKYDAIESIIYNGRLSIAAINFFIALDLMVIVLNTKVVLHQPISAYPSLKGKSIEELQNFELIGNGTGIHWPSLDEDLSLKGFLTDEMKKLVNPFDTVAA